MPRISVRSRTFLLLILCGCVLPLTTTAPASAREPAQPTSADFRIDIALKPDGRAHVSEEVDVTADGYAALTAIGVPYKRPVGGERYQVARISGLRANVSSDAQRGWLRPVEDRGTDKEIAFMHPATPGPVSRFVNDHYTIDYDLDGLVTRSGDRTRFTWDPVGTAAGVPGDRVDVILNAPGGVRAASGRIGDAHARMRSGGRAKVAHGGASYTAEHLPNGHGFTVTADLAPGAVATASPRYERISDPDAAVTPGAPGPTAPALAITAVLLALALGTVWWARRFTRTARAGVAPGLPDGMTPGMATFIGGAIRDRPRADAVAVTVTLLDLARRGHLDIERCDGADWRLARRMPGDELAPYESRLLDGLFAAGDVPLSRLRGRYALARELRTGLRDAARARGWLFDAMILPVVAIAPVLLALIGAEVAADRLVGGWPFVASGLVVLAVTVAWCALPRCRRTRAGLAAAWRVRALRDQYAAGFTGGDEVYAQALGVGGADPDTFAHQAVAVFRAPADPWDVLRSSGGERTAAAR